MIIIFEHHSLKQKAEQLGQQLKLPVKFVPESTSAGIERQLISVLAVTNDRLEFRNTKSSLEPFSIDFTNSTLSYRVKHGGRKKEALARAVGLKKNRTPVIFDLTAGLGRDAFILASLGCHVHLFERNPILSALLEDGLQRTAQTELSATTDMMQIHHGDSIDLLGEISKSTRPDVIYIDPMFPHRTKSALVKKELRIIRELVGDDLDAEILFERALQHPGSRVVCKRPNQAPSLGNRLPDLKITGKKQRFDIYLT
jgi:16S rRNA (guanine1516-N2)-methyltransferase